MTPARVLRSAEWDGMPVVTEVPSPDGRLWLTEAGFDLGLRDADSDTVSTLTNSGTSTQPWRVNAQVYSLLPDPAVWSPDGRYVVSVQADFCDVPQHPVESSSRQAGGRPVVIDTTTGDLVWIDVPAHVLWAPVRWLRNGSTVVLLGLEFSGVLWLVRASAETGNASVVVQEQVPGVFPYLARVVSAARASDEDSTVDWWVSDRDGDSRLYRLTPGRVCPATPQGVQIDGIISQDPLGLIVAARPNPSAPYDVKACRVGADGFDVVEGSTQACPHDDGGEPFVVTAADGQTLLHGVVFDPSAFATGDSHPVVNCIYGGPQTIAHRDEAPHVWGSPRAVAATLSKLGFVTTVIDARGTPGRGRAFQWPTVPDRIGMVVDDHRAALEQLARTRPWMDLSRCAAVGTSFGAYFATWSGLRHPDLYRAVVAHAGPYDLEQVLPGWFPSLLQATYVEDPDAFRQASVVTHASDYEPALLLLHGTDDTNVAPEHSLRLSAALTAAGRDHELVVLPDQRHHLDDDAAAFALDVAGRFLQRLLAAT